MLATHAKSASQSASQSSIFGCICDYHKIACAVPGMYESAVCICAYAAMVYAIAVVCVEVLRCVGCVIFPLSVCVGS